MSNVEQWEHDEQRAMENEIEKVEKRFEYATERLADKADSGLNRNLDHAKYFTRVVSETI